MSIIEVVLIVLAVEGCFWLYRHTVVPYRLGSRVRKLEKEAGSYLENIASWSKTMFDQDDYDENVARMIDWHTRLKGKYRGDIRKALAIAVDWKNYTSFEFSRLVSMRIWLDAADVAEEATKRESVRDWMLKIDEIEKHWADTLGSEYVQSLLESKRKEQEEQEAAWPLET